MSCSRSHHESICLESHAIRAQRQLEAGRVVGHVVPHGVGIDDWHQGCELGKPRPSGGRDPRVLAAGEGDQDRLPGERLPRSGSTQVHGQPLEVEHPVHLNGRERCVIARQLLWTEVGQQLHLDRGDLPPFPQQEQVETVGPTPHQSWHHDLPTDSVAFHADQARDRTWVG